MVTCWHATKDCIDFVDAGIRWRLGLAILGVFGFSFKTRSTQKKMPGPEVQQLHNVGLPGARWRVPTSFSFCTCPLYFAWVFLSYLMPPHFIGIFSLGPSILFYFLRCLTPPWQQTRVLMLVYVSLQDSVDIQTLILI